MLDNTHYIVSDWNEKLLSPKVHINRLKRCILNLQEINERGQLNVANNVRDLFCKSEEVLQKLRRRNENGENEKERKKRFECLKVVLDSYRRKYSCFFF